MSAHVWSNPNVMAEAETPGRARVYVNRSRGQGGEGRDQMISSSSRGPTRQGPSPSKARACCPKYTWLALVRLD